MAEHVINAPFMEDIVYNTAARLKPIGLFHVEYVQGDIVGHALGFSSFLPYFIGWSLLTLIVFKRDLHTICYLAGILVNEVINFVLKHVIKEPRPDVNRIGAGKYGMPSNHSQFMAFFATYLLFFLFARLHKAESFRGKFCKNISALAGVVSTAIVMYGRVYLGYHTISQVLCGCGVGAVLGMLWFLLVQFVLTSFFPVIASSRVGEFFMLNDSTLIPNVLWFEYCTNRVEMKNRRRKLNSHKSS